MRIYLLIAALVFATVLSAQNKISKPAVDTSVLTKFPYMGKESISNDGAYISYVINGQPKGGSTVVIQSTESDWKKELIYNSVRGVDAPPGNFSEDSRVYLFKIKDTLFFVSLGGEGKTQYLTNIETYQQPIDGHDDWWAYKLKGKEKELVLQNRKTGQEQRFNGVEEYGFNDKGTRLVLKIQTAIETELTLLDLQNNEKRTIWSAKNAKIGGYSFDKDDKQLTFITEEKNEKQSAYSIWYYKEGADKAMKQADDKTAGINQNLFIANVAPSFNPSGQYIYFKLSHPADSRKPLTGSAKLSIWSYRDTVIQSLQEKSEKKYWASIAVNGTHVLHPEQEDEVASTIGVLDLAMIRNHASINEFWQPSYEEQKQWLVSLKNGMRQILPFSSRTILTVSPINRYIVYFSSEKLHYFSYDISGGRARDISGGIPFPLYDKALAAENARMSSNFAYGIAGWLDESGFLVYDEYDIWKLDPSAIKPPVNLTNGYGRLNHIRLRLLDKDGIGKTLNSNSIILTALDTKTQHTGYYRMVLGQYGNPKLLSIEACYWGNSLYGGTEPLKARDADKWIVSRQKADESPEYYFTNDFSHFKQLTHLQPQEQYNWMTSQLISWKRPDGLLNKGILYKPENFDPHKKYPLLFYYYEKMTQDLFHYIRPGYNEGDLDIPWFVSHGYLVCTPDIHYAVGKPGQSALQSVESAAIYLSRFSYVDANHMGIQGFSFGGYETNYIVSHSAMFAAACEGAGSANCISDYSAIRGGHGKENKINQVIEFENGQYKMGGSLWQTPKDYIESSPIFKANQVTTPLLMIHNKEDASVPWHLGIEWYAGLRRLQKQVWMLEYDGGGHGLGGVNGVDFIFRSQQFFDHYLKGAPAPIWMTRGIPAKVKGIEMRYELDSAGNCGASCKVCKKWNEIYHGSSVRTSGNKLSEKEAIQGRASVLENRPKPIN
ncbi:MAG: prolyl oligopeptidase family serine peptidase [Bacteroidota bacterium]